MKVKVEFSLEVVKVVDTGRLLSLESFDHCFDRRA